VIFTHGLQLAVSDLGALARRAGAVCTHNCVRRGDVRGTRRAVKEEVVAVAMTTKVVTMG
jgi:hypothetical protein